MYIAWNVASMRIPQRFVCVRRLKMFSQVAIVFTAASYTDASWWFAIFIFTYMELGSAFFQPIQTDAEGLSHAEKEPPVEAEVGSLAAMFMWSDDRCVIRLYSCSTCADLLACLFRWMFMCGYFTKLNRPYRDE